MMNWTGNPYVDIGLAAILAFCQVDEPQLLTPSDLNDVATWLADNYARNPLKSFLTVAFTSNAWFSQPSFSDEKRIERGRLHLWAWKTPGNGDERCVFTGLPATGVTLSDSLKPGRAARAQIPLAQGDEDINFYPNGDAGLPISGEALLCLQAFPLRCAKVAGRLLAVHASDPAITLAFARRFLDANRTGAQLAQEAGSSKLRETPFTLGTALIGALTEILSDPRLGPEDDMRPLSITAYHLTNSQDPGITVHHLPLGVTRFLRRVRGARYRDEWLGLVRSFRPPDESKKAQPRKASNAPAAARADRPQRNPLLEDLLRLPEEGAAFLRRYLVRRAGLGAGETNSDRKPALPVSWDLTGLFLLEVLNMDKTRIEAIRHVGDQLAAYIRAENDRRFFQAFFGEMKYPLFRNALIKADSGWVRRGNPPLITFDQYLEVFEEGDDWARADWKLARDLVLIRLIEQLHGNGWLAGNPDALPEISADAGEETTPKIEEE